MTYESLWDFEKCVDYFIFYAFVNSLYYSVKWAVADSHGAIFDAGYFLAVCAFNSREVYSSFVYCYFSWLDFPSSLFSFLIVFFLLMYDLVLFFHLEVVLLLVLSLENLSQYYILMITLLCILLFGRIL